MSTYEREELRGVAIHYLLLAQDKKHGLVKLSDLKKVFPKTYDKKTVIGILDEVVREMKDLFGIEVCVVDTGKGTFVLLKNEIDSGVPYLDSTVDSGDKLENAKKGVLLAVLMYIFMAKNPEIPSSSVTSTAVSDFLETLGLNNIQQLDLEKLISPKPTAEFITEGWIDFEKSSDRDGNESVFYSWGPRAKACVDPKKVFELFCAIDGGDPEEWKDYKAFVDSSKKDEQRSS
ncbi:unnamed protein product [Enterobius vermicularis]|uniref:MAGE domain-containing protein n=1 Tax=Enterobius vermicularis TaxID=51028 RepID=A0A0N4V5Z1_ENTVE|nr:unnamed protein product [Enterobius vermicularis]